MKKSILLIGTLICLTSGTNAFALVAYNQSYDSGIALNNGKGNGSTTFTFTGVTDSFLGSATTPFPTLSLMLTGSNSFSDTLYLQVGSQNLATFTAANPTYQFNDETLKYLNGAITNNSVTFSLVRNSGTSVLDSARLTGTVAPEPMSMALVGAGLVGLPFARRLKKALKP